MITLHKAAYQEMERNAIYRALSTDDYTNPGNYADLHNGDVIELIDTSQTFMYNADDGKFYLQKNGGGSASVDIATDTTPGIVAVGDGLEIEAASGKLSVKPATATDIGGVKPGDGLEMNLVADGTVDLKMATADDLGGIKVGTGLSIDPLTGELSATGVQAAIATDTSTGVVMVGDNLTIESTTGKLSAVTPIATDAAVGGIKLGANDGITVGADGTVKVDQDYVRLDGTLPMQAALNMNGQQIKGVAAATNNDDAVNLKQMNDAIMGGSFTLPAATEDDLGGVIVGDGLAVTVDGTLSAELTPEIAEATYIKLTEKGVADGVATLGADGLIPTSQLPSYVDDVVEYANKAAFPPTGEAGKIYVALDTNITYRWGGTEYVEISASLALGETHSTAYYGDFGKAAYDHSQIVDANPHNTTAAQVGALPTVGGAMTGSIAMGTNKITGLANGTDATDAVTKGQLDTKQDAITGTQGQFVGFDANGDPEAKDLPLASDTVLGVVKKGDRITIGADGTISADDQNGITQDEADARYLQLAGGTMTGEINMNNNNITGAYNIVANGSTSDGLRFENNGSTARILCGGGTTAISFNANSIDAYDHRVARVGTPINDTDAARKVDVDTVANTVNNIIDGTEPLPYLPEDGGTLSGNLDMGSNKITNLAAPVNPTDAVRQQDLEVLSDEIDHVIDGTTPIKLPEATDVKLGAIMVGEGLSVEADGTLSANKQVVEAHVVGQTPLATDWLSETAGGQALTPEAGVIYMVVTTGDYENQMYRYDETTTAYVAVSSTGSASGDYLEKTGGDMTGSINFNSTSGIKFDSSTGNKAITWDNGSGAKGAIQFFNNQINITPNDNMGTGGTIMLNGIATYSPGAHSAPTQPGDLTSKNYVDSAVSGFKSFIGAYIVGSTTYAEDWLSDEDGGTALTPAEGRLYIILSAGTFLNKLYRWDAAENKYILVSSQPITTIASPNPNLLDNWDFTNLINRKGTTAAGSPTDAPERWINSWTSSPPHTWDSTNGFGISYSLHVSYAPDFKPCLLQAVSLETLPSLYNKPFVLSVLTRDYGLFTLSGVMPSTRDYSFAPETDITSDDGTVKGKIKMQITDEGNWWIPCRIENWTTDEVLYILAVKLEIGYAQSLATQNDGGEWILTEAMDYQDMIRRLNYYYEPVTSSFNSGSIPGYGGQGVILGYGYTQTGNRTTNSFPIIYPSPKYQGCDITYSGSLRIRRGSDYTNGDLILASVGDYTKAPYNVHSAIHSISRKSDSSWGNGNEFGVVIVEGNPGRAVFNAEIVIPSIAPGG